MRGPVPALSRAQLGRCADLYAAGWKADDLAALFGVSRRTVYRSLRYSPVHQRMRTLVRLVAPEADPAVLDRVAREAADLIERRLQP